MSAGRKIIDLAPDLPIRRAESTGIVPRKDVPHSLFICIDLSTMDRIGKNLAVAVDKIADGHAGEVEHIIGALRDIDNGIVYAGILKELLCVRQVFRILTIGQQADDTARCKKDGLLSARGETGTQPTSTRASAMASA